MLTVLSRAALRTGRLQAAAALSTSACALKDASKQRPIGDPDEYIFRHHCKGERKPSAEAQEVNESLRRADFGSLKRRRAPQPGTAAAAPGPGATLGTSQPRTQATTSPPPAAADKAAGFATDSARSIDDAAQELTEKGSKRLMQSDDGREELRQGSFDLDRTAERVLEEGKKDASPELAARAEQQEVKDAVKSRVVSGSQTS